MVKNGLKSLAYFRGWIKLGGSEGGGGSERGGGREEGEGVREEGGGGKEEGRGSERGGRGEGGGGGSERGGERREGGREGGRMMEVHVVQQHYNLQQPLAGMYHHTL